MSNGKASPQGILRCRDLTTLLYGVPMVAVVKESRFERPEGTILILEQDARRIRYEIVLTNIDAAATDNIRIGSHTAIDDNRAEVFTIARNATLLIIRDFRTDLDAVTVELWASDDDGQLVVSVRETILSPAPVDEIPLP